MQTAGSEHKNQREVHTIPVRVCKEAGLKPLSLERAKELLGGTIDVSVFS